MSHSRGIAWWWGVAMDFRILGRLEVLVDDEPVAISMPKIRILLAALLLRPDRTVGTDELVDRLWSGSPPRTPRPTLQTYVRRLRQTIGDPRRIVTSTHGYQIAIDQDELDLCRFRDLVARAGRQQNPTDESRLLGEALGQWRGYPLADVQSDLIQSHDVPVLEGERLGALERRFDVELSLGRHANLVRELQVAIGEYPMRERFYGQLMVALYRSGRQADAFGVYENVKDMLAGELGLDPSEELRTIRQNILTNDPSIAAPSSHDPVTTVRPSATPRELPPVVGDFVGREDVRARISGVLASDSGVTVAVIVGPPGVGKTALAVQVAHESRARFPDGQLYADMRGYSSAPALIAAEVLARFLVSLGVPSARIPSDQDELSALYRSRLADRKVLILLDNVVNPNQVRPVLPGTSGCAVIVTSRNELRGLTALQGVRPIALGVLPIEQSRALLGNILGDDIADTERVTELAQLCGHLPLALRIAAANLLAQHDLGLPDYIAELRANRLSALEIDGDDQAAVRAAFDLSYRTLDERAARVFRLLGLIPGQDFTADAVAALAALPVTDAGQVLDQLVAGNLAMRGSPRRYQLHDLLRAYAAELSSPDEESTPARSRLFGFYLKTVDAAAEQLFPIWLLMPRPHVDPVVRPLTFDDAAAATSWMDRECLNALDVMVAAVRHGLPEFAWSMSETMRAYLVTSGRYHAEGVSAYTIALRAAVAAGDHPAEAAVLYVLGSLHLQYAEPRHAARYYAEAARVNQEMGELAGQTRALTGLGGAHMDAGELDLAARHITSALELGPLTDYPMQALSGWVNLAEVELRRGNLGQAERAVTAALSLCEYDDSRMLEAAAHRISGQVLVRRGRCVEAIGEFEQALTCYLRMPMPSDEVAAQAGLSAAYLEIGDQTAALARARLALRRAADDEKFDSDTDALLPLAAVQRAMGRFDEADVNYRKALELCRRMHYPVGEVDLLLGCAENNRARGNLDAAAELADQAVAFAQRCGYRTVDARARTVAAWIELDRGDPSKAMAIVQDAVLVSGRLGAWLDEARALYVRGLAEQASGSPDLAQESWQAADRALIDSKLPDTAEIRQQLAAALC
jgi:DNA-binding SARP family transcriptional activator/tetratricopeptide (TPR) repeat protein